MPEVKDTNDVTQSGNTVAIGDLAGRDIIHQHTGTLEAFIIQHLEQKLVPMLNEESINIKDSIGTQIREIINQQVLNPLKRDLEMENINYHLSVLKEELKNKETTPQYEASKKEIVDRAEIVNEWLVGMEKIPKEEEELSRIWEGWYIDFYEGKSSSDLQFILSKMKSLSSIEAIALLNLNQRFPNNNNQYKEIRKAQYIYDQLLKKELIVIYTSCNLLIPPAIAGSITGFIIYLIIEIVLIEYSAFGIPLFLTFIASSWTPYFLRRRIKNYKRTWIGGEIVSYADRINDKTNSEDTE